MLPPGSPPPAGAAPCTPLPSGTAPVADLLRVEDRADDTPVPPPVRRTATVVRAAPRGVYVRAVRPAAGALLVAALALPVALAVGAVAALQLFVERDPRRVFFVQTRAGRYGLPFRIYKFRTLEMGPDAELRPTRLGRFLRRTHLDELPQLWNVARGDMALIGPRPETPEIEAWAEESVPGFGSRLALAPGITGLAQVVQDSTPPVQDLYAEKLRLNEVYMERISARMDAWILLRTALRPFRPRRDWNAAARATSRAASGETSGSTGEITPGASSGRAPGQPPG